MFRIRISLLTNSLYLFQNKNPIPIIFTHNQRDYNLNKFECSFHKDAFAQLSTHLVYEWTIKKPQGSFKTC